MDFHTRKGYTNWKSRVCQIKSLYKMPVNEIQTFTGLVFLIFLNIFFSFFWENIVKCLERKRDKNEKFFTID